MLHAIQSTNPDRRPERLWIKHRAVAFRLEILWGATTQGCLFSFSLVKLDVCFLNTGIEALSFKRRWRGQLLLTSTASSQQTHT